MFCVHCGKEISDNSRFCEYCGGEQPTSNSTTINNMIDSAGNDIGNGIDEAVDEIKKEINNGNEAFSKGVETVGQHTENIRNNWKDYITPENMELLAALVLALPLFMGIVNAILGPILGFFRIIPLIGFIFKILPGLIRLVFVLVSAAGVASIAYLLLNNEGKRNTWAYITAASDVLAFLSCLGIMFRWKGTPFFFGLICLIYGIDCISRVIVQRKGIESQPEVGKDLEAYKIWYENYKSEHPTNDNSMNTATPYNSYFDGTGLSLLGLYFLTILLCTITCGLAAPWMICKILKWRKTHTVINGKRLAFNGTGGSLFGHWIIWEILSIVTCGIYTFFVHVALRRWEMQHTTYEDQPTGSGQFDGNSFQYFGYGLLQTLLLLISCGLAAPWTITMIQKWEMKHSIIITDRLKYEGTALGLLGQYIIVFLLTVITLGIYSPWGTIRINKYIYSHTHVDA